MEYICQELSIPRKQIKETNTKNRFKCIVHKNFLKVLVKSKKIVNARTYPGAIDEWPQTKDLGSNWEQVYLVAHKKLNHKVIPLQKFKSDASDNELPLTYSQQLYQVQQTNHKILWKNANKKYSSEYQQQNESTGNNGKQFVDSALVPYEIALREVITRMYGCPIIHYKLDRIKNDSISDDITFNCHFDVEMHHINQYPLLGAIESNSHFYLIYQNVIENTLLDCVSYSPGVLEKSYNKNMFIIYQLINLQKSTHDKGLVIGEINLSDIYLTENCLLRIIPKLESNLIKYEHCESTENESFESTSIQLLSNPELSLKDYCQMWCTGQLSNFDYLTILNNYAGRKIDSPDYHHIMPWVTDFSSKNGNWRDLTKTKYRLTKGDAQLDITYQHIKNSAENSTTPHHVSDVLSEITFYVYMARKTPKSVLCRHVRPKFVAAEYPASIKRLQEWTPDECIPEFFNDPSVFKSINEDLPDLEVPVWSSCPEDFIVKHREALESQYVSENLHHWIDLTFGYKLSGKAAVKAKNVVLTLVDDHQKLCQRGVVQLFTSHHPPKQFKNPWFQKNPPRISSSELRKRLTRSTDDLSMDNYYAMESTTSNTPPTRLSSSPRRSSYLPYQSESIERSPSYHASAPRGLQSLIALPSNYNPLHQLKAVENMGNFISKTFYEKPSTKPKKIKQNSLDYPLTSSFQNYLFQNYEQESDNAFTNMMFLETYEASLKDSKMYQNFKQRKQQALNSKKHFKQLMQENKVKELKIIGCIIIELFMSRKLRPLLKQNQLFEERFEACKLLLKNDEHQIPDCVICPIKLLFGMETGDDTQITILGLPPPSAGQLLQPMLSNILIPFPDNFFKIYAAIKSLSQFESSVKMLELYSSYDCDGKNCEKFETQDKARVGIHRKIAECKVKAFSVLSEGLLEPSGFERLHVVEIFLPHIIDMFQNEETGILSAWYLFDNFATAIGIENTKKYLLTPILGLYDVHYDDRANFFNSSYDSTIRYTATSFRSKKAVKLYHHSFLLKLIVRFGLKCFLDNFISMLIEAAGGAKDSEIEFPYHIHDSSQTENQMSSKDFQAYSNDSAAEGSPTLVSPGSNDDEDDKTMASKLVQDEMFEFDNDDTQTADTDAALAKIIDQFDIKSETGSIDMKMGLSEADEAEELSEETNNDDQNRFSLGGEKLKLNPKKIDSLDPKSPTIPIPSSVYKRGISVASIGCEIGSRKSNDSFDILSKTPLDRDESVKSKIEDAIDDKSEIKSWRGRSRTRQSRSTRISEMSTESLLWLSHRLGPVLTARYVTKNLLKMLTLCYVSQENLLPSTNANLPQNIGFFSVADGQVVGDENATKVLDCLTAISALFGEHFILCQYLPHVTELIALCKKKITTTLEGGLISCIQLIKFVIPCLSDATIMEQMQDNILKNIIKPVIRLLNSTHFAMPSGFLARGVLARKLIDLFYVLTLRIGTEIAREHLCIPHLQRFFLIFDKAYGFDDPNDSNPEELREKGLEELKEVFTPSLAHAVYLPFVRQFGENTMKQTVKNLMLVLNLCHEHEVPNYATDTESIKVQETSYLTSDHVDSPHSFGTNVSIVGNRLDYQNNEQKINDQSNMIDQVAYKLQNVTSNRQLKGNWLAYWTNEIGRHEKDQSFNLKQIKLQTFSGHTNSVRGILCLDNENSFMSASKDKTVKLWSLRSEGDGSKISPCQFTYTGHRKSVHSLAFLESMRLAVSCDSGVHLWDPFVGAQINQIEGQKYTPISIVRTFPGPSSLILAGTADSTIKVIDSRIADYVLEWKLNNTPSGSVRCLTIAPSGSWIAVGLSAGQIVMLDGKTGIIQASWKASEGELLQMQAPNDVELITSSLDNSISVWNAQSGSLMYNLR
ncbi:hypothetical protein ACKWTF_002080 [Chironomus riparius]